ncbi:winged helix-turn-helix domain-containing protein [Janthinobacterium fluminis]|uniref:Winged helix-turn-helix domain-containing protein n=1 Tax=Janthinobacterium fluminis TaxID=2987524 RepID=A0ABT5JY48_9BURK|nr:winged helix-turn-helix domain-containing protein [Janthinobacterium fluminis]MDC8757105.1 winged helix-turn-helix domain-containing protein [Janthinobacterium fluminis]
MLDSKAFFDSPSGAQALPGGDLTRAAAFQFGEWEVRRSSNSLHQGELRRQMEPRAMDVLLALCSRAGEVISSDELLLECWGNKASGDNPVHKTIAQLRRLLGDNSTAPVYLETIRKRGYRTIAAVRLPPDAALPVVPAWSGASPFCGLRPFDRAHAAVFFGRGDATLQLARACARQVAGGRAQVLVLGPSGSGKTSLVRAGLLPQLAQGGHGFTLASDTQLDLAEAAPGDLFTCVASALLDWEAGPAPLFAGHSAATLGQALRADPAAVLAALCAALDAAALPADARLLLFLDRFEAVFTLPDVSEAERLALIALIERCAACPRLFLVLACRNDFYPRIADYPALLEGKADGAHFDLAPPTHAEIAHMIRLPAQAAGLSFGVDPQSPARLDDMLGASVTGNPDALPLLQYTLQELYRLRSPAGELTLAAYAQLGGVDGAIGRRAEEVVAGFDQARRNALPRILSLVVTVSPGSDAVTGRRAPWSALASQAERDVVGALVDARLFASQLVGAEAGFGVAHEALLRRWSRATDWIATHRSSLRVAARIAVLSARWASEGRPPDLLLPPGMQLDEARALQQRGAVPLSADDLALIAASGRKARRRERLRNGVIAAILTLALLVAALGLSATRARQTAEQRRGDAEGLIDFMLGDFADKLRPLGKLDLLDGISAKALAYLTEAGGAQQGAAAQLQRAKALQVIGEVRVARGDGPAAATAFDAARTVLQPLLAAQPANTELLKLLGANAFWLGRIGLNRNDWPVARQYFTLYRDYSDRLQQADPNNVDAWVEQSYAHNNLGTLALRQGDARTAAAEFLLSVELKTRAVARKPDDLLLAKELADSLSWVADTQQDLGELESAAALYERELALAERLHAAAPADVVWSNSLARALQHRAHLAQARGRPALDDYRRADALLTANLAREPANRVWQRNLLFGRIEQQRPPAQPAAALAALAANAPALAALTRLDPHNADWAWLEASAWERRAGLLLQTGRLREAAEVIALSRHSLEKLHARNAAEGRVRYTLAHTLLHQARLHHMQGDGAGRALACTQARDLLAAQAVGSSDFRVLDPWVRAHACLKQAHTASTAAALLTQIGYRDAAYLQYLSQPN